MEWSNDLILEFLQLYENEAAIWNPKHPRHKDRGCVHNAWKRIQAKLSVRFSIFDLKKKKDSLMATYRKLSHKLMAMAGAEGDEVFKPDWFAYEIMSRFLQGIYKPNIGADYCAPHSEVVDSWPVLKMEFPDNSEQMNDEEPEDEDFTENEASTSVNVTQPVRRKRKVEPEVSSMDECALYAELLAKKLRALDEDAREVAMLEIDHLIFRLKQSKNFMVHTPPSIQLFTPSAQYFVTKEAKLRKEN